MLVPKYARVHSLHIHSINPVVYTKCLYFWKNTNFKKLRHFLKDNYIHVYWSNSAVSICCGFVILI